MSMCKYCSEEKCNHWSERDRAVTKDGQHSHLLGVSTAELLVCCSKLPSNTDN